jgi:predicted dehydrogenase
VLKSFSDADVRALGQRWPMPAEPRPIVIVGAGEIVAQAHLPAYRKAGWPVAGIFDLERDKARPLAAQFGIATVYQSFADALAVPNAVVDVAVPPAALPAVVEALPRGTSVIMQKPMGCNFEEASRILHVCRARNLTAAVNLQLRFGPAFLALREAIAAGMLGELVDLEVRLSCHTPWEDWGADNRELEFIEMTTHSIHYISWIRSVLGDPVAAYARSVRDPRFPEASDCRTSAILDYGDTVRCCLSLNHTNHTGPVHRQARITLMGTRGGAILDIGLMLNYPTDAPDRLEIATEGVAWTEVPLQGRWYPDAFLGIMAHMQRYLGGEDETLTISAEDAIRTMAVVEACRRSDAAGGTPLPEIAA